MSDEFEATRRRRRILDEVLKTYIGDHRKPDDAPPALLASLKRESIISLMAAGLREIERRDKEGGR